MQVGTVKSPKLTKIRKLFLALHDAYDLAIKPIEKRVGMNPPRLRKPGQPDDAVAPNTSEQADATPTAAPTAAPTEAPTEASNTAKKEANLKEWEDALKMAQDLKAMADEL